MCFQKSITWTLNLDQYKCDRIKTVNPFFVIKSVIFTDFMKQMTDCINRNGSLILI